MNWAFRNEIGEKEDRLIEKDQGRSTAEQNKISMRGGFDGTTWMQLPLKKERNLDWGYQTGLACRVTRKG